MSNISGKETKPEIIVRKYLFANGFRFRKNDKRYPGKPDMVRGQACKLIFSIILRVASTHFTNLTYVSIPPTISLSILMFPIGKNRSII